MAWGWLVLTLVSTSWLHAQPAASSRKCTYDDATSTFHFSPGKKMRLIFGVHGVPSFIDTYIRGGDPRDVKRVRELIAGHKEILPSMHRVFDSSLKQFRQDPPTWISYENSQKDIDGVGGFQGLMKFLSSEDVRMQKLGLSPEERKSYLMIMTDPVLAAQYWLRNKEGKTELPAPALHGFDNARTAGQTEAKAESRKILTTYRAKISELDDEKYDVPEWFIKDYYARKISMLLYDSPNESVKQFRELVADPRFKQITEPTRSQLLSLRDFAANNAPSLQRTLDEDAIEFARRDREIARDLFSTHVASHGAGFAHVGAAHKAGVLESLKATCLNPGAPGSVSPAASGARSPTVK